MKEKILLSILIILLIPFASAQTVDTEISQLISFAEQYEMGNNEYLELLIQASLTRERVNEILGTITINEYSSAGITTETAEQYFGFPKGYTKYAWSSSSKENVHLEEDVPWFEKIIFDGKRIQVTFHAWPHVYEIEEEQTMYYWTDFQIRYKNKLNLDLETTLEQIESSGTSFLEGSGSASEIAQLIVKTEREVREYVDQNKENCESVMNDLFSSGSLQSNEKSERWNIDFYEGKNIDVTLTISMPECAESCQWPWINLWFEPRSNKQIDFSGYSGSGDYNQESFQDYTIEQLEQELTTTFKDLQNQIQQVDQDELRWDALSENQDKLQTLNKVLSEKYYNQEDQNQDDKPAFEQRKSQLQNIISEFGARKTEIVQERRYEQKLVANLVNHQDGWCQNTNEISCNPQEEACIAGACTYALGGNEDCENALDDDEDTVIDCADPDCAISCGKFCQNVCQGDCGECRNDCYESSCKECWNCDWESDNEGCNTICESSGCNACTEACQQQSFCSECTACESSLQTTQQNECINECSPCTDCRAQYELAEEAEQNCAETCDPCTLCKAPSLELACYQACDEISSGMQRDTCYGLCDDQVLFICNSQQQYTPCSDTTYICDGVIQPFPCTIYSCETEAGIQKQTIPCGQEFCGENQILEENRCMCIEGFYDCDNDGSCTDVSSCGEQQESCTDAVDNDGDQLVDCQDISECEAQLCGEGNFCHEGSCLSEQELTVCAEEEILTNGICRKQCTLQEECSESEYCSYGYCSTKKTCINNEECSATEECQQGFCETILQEESPLETGESCVLENDCSGERDICSEGVCKEIPEENYNQLIEDGLLLSPEREILTQEKENVPEEMVFEETLEEQPFVNTEEVGESLTGFVIWATSVNAMTGKSVSSSCATDENCGENQGCDTYRGECYCKDTFFDCNEDINDGCESSDATCGGTRELCPGGCGTNQYCNEQKGYCDCKEDFYNCDGLWWDCESETECTSCMSNEECAQPTCAPYDSSVVITFGCMKGSSWQEEKGSLAFSGGCTSFPTGQVQPWVHFDSWGEPFDEINNERTNIEKSLGNDWCLQEKENALKQRAEIERSLQDPEFMETLFTNLLTEDMEEWQTNTEAIYGMYWSIVENTRQLARSAQCLGEEYPRVTPLELSYEFEAGGIEMWEENAYAKEFDLDVLTPYMKLGIFPPKELIKEELRSAAAEGHFPGNDEQVGPSVEELEKIREDPQQIEYIKELTSKYDDGSLDAKITFLDQEKSIFIIDFSISEEKLFQVKPVISYEKEADITVEINFDFMYDFIAKQERDARIEHPEWVKDSFQENVDDAINTGLTVAKISSALATGDISVSPLSEIGTAVKLLGHMFEGK